MDIKYMPYSSIQYKYILDSFVKLPIFYSNTLETTQTIDVFSAIMNGCIKCSVTSTMLSVTKTLLSGWVWQNTFSNSLP